MGDDVTESYRLTDEPINAATDYHQFLDSKRLSVPSMGIDVLASDLNPNLFDFQRDVSRWALKRGRAALFEDCGLGKTIQQLEWARHVAEYSGESVLILAPLAVAQQTRREGERFGIDVTVCREQADVRRGVNITNYEMLSHFVASRFGGVVLDESGILKSYMGATKRALVESFAHTPFRLACTATPAPNDHTELGNHAEFLGIMSSSEMLSRWFINDTKHTGVYRLKRHAESDFWEWVASWAVALAKPSDLGYPDDGFILPELRMHHVEVEVDITDPTGQQLFRTPEMSATTLHQEMRRTVQERAREVAGMVSPSPEPWIVWCHTNYEADELVRLLPNALEVRGTESLAAKERKLAAFSDGSARVLISKPSICGWGLNWQHCHNIAFVGLSYSFEELYQAIKRAHRFGQKHPVDVWLVGAQTEGAILARVQEKMAAHERMVAAMRAATAKQLQREDLVQAAYEPRVPMEVPNWLRSVA